MCTNVYFGLLLTMLKLRCLLYFCLSIFGLYQVSAQTVRTVTSLSDDLEENSGMVHYGNGVLYFINDSGNDPILYRYDTVTNAYSEFEMLNASNVDWEDLATDDLGNIYIGDFGNNNNRRRDLKIYKAVNPESVFTNELSVETISYTYENQTQFPPANEQLYFDCEAMIWYKDSIYLFTKNRTEPFDGWCYMYSLPDEPGSYVAKLIDSIQFSASDRKSGWITAADIYMDTLALLSSGKVHLTKISAANTLLKGEWVTHSVGFSQKEAVAFANGQEIFISDELNVIGQNLYLLDTRRRGANVNVLSARKFDVSQTSSSLHIKLKKRRKAKVYVFSVMGPEILSMTFDNKLTISGVDLPAGTYVIQLLIDGESYDFKWAKTE
jgi:hypothetical protein